MGAMTLTKPVITVDQMVRASEAAKKFGEIRRKAKDEPQFITEKGMVDTVLLDYELYEQMFEIISEVCEMAAAEKEEERMLLERVERLEKKPGLAIPWREVKRTK